MLKKIAMWMLWIVGFLAVAIILLRFFFPLPDISERADSLATPPSPETTLGALMLRDSADQGDTSGVLPLVNGRDALASRLALIDAAEASLDAQYYIWHDDTSGILLLDALSRAADRGVRVRLLLDDNGIPGLDPIVATLNAHPNFQIRLFNPSPVRNPKALGYTFDFFRMNRRMHNKALVADGAAAIIGGRNIGDEYFEVIQDAFYVDMDVLALGQVASETAASFDQYWNSQSVYEAENIVKAAADLPKFQARVADIKNSPEAADVLGDSKNSARDYLTGETSLEWTTVQLFVDDPKKGLGTATQGELMIFALAEILGTVEARLDLVSAYFVPAKEGTASLAALTEGGKSVNILTNALNTTDVLMVHAGYSKYRRELLEADVNLFEFKLRSPELETQRMPLSGASLHAKTFALDGKRIFVGSFNFDPRSARLNCEMGFLIDSPTMAGNISKAFDDQLRTASYRPALTPEDKMVWRETTESGDVRIYQEEPGAHMLQQIALAILGILPIEWLL